MTISALPYSFQTLVTSRLVGYALYQIGFNKNKYESQAAYRLYSNNWINPSARSRNVFSFGQSNFISRLLPTSKNGSTNPTNLSSFLISSKREPSSGNPSITNFFSDKSSSLVLFPGSISLSFSQQEVTNYLRHRRALVMDSMKSLKSEFNLAFIHV